MGLVSHTPRSATIQAEVASVLYVLDAHQFEAIKRENPELGRKLLTYFVSVMAERLTERLTFANRMIAVLRSERRGVPVRSARSTLSNASQ